MAAERLLFILFCFYLFLRRKSKTTLAEGINMCIRSKRRLYEDNQLVYIIQKIPPAIKNLAYV